MKTTLLPLVLGVLLMLSAASVAQVRVIKPVKKRPKTTNMTIGGGIASSMLFLSQNVKENNSAKGLNGIVTYGGYKSNLRLSLEYVHYKKLDFDPTWYNIKAHTIEANLHILAHFKNMRAYFYPLVGLSYNTFSGRFTGINDFLHLSALYQPNTTATKRWLGVNVGTGFEKQIKRMSIYAEYKMRVGTVENHKQLSIMDVCLFAGVRYNFKAPSIYSIFRGTRSRYVLDTERSYN